GDSELKLKFPEEWNVTVQAMEGHGKKPVDKEEIIYALRNPIGTKPLSRLAQGKKDVAVIFDDMTRPTKAYEVLPHVINELRKAGIKDANIRFVCANGSHGVFDRKDFVKKLGESVVESYPVFNHNPYANFVYSGRTKYGTPVEINAEVMACDLKIALGCIVPHPYFGYGGGAKIVLPGVASMRSICYNHGDLGGFSTAQDHRKVHPSCDLAYGRVNEENILRLDSEEAAKIAGLDMIVNVLVDLRRNSTEIFAGDVVKAQREGVEAAKEHYRTPLPSEADIVVSNAYSKATEAAIASWPVLTLREGGDFVLIVNAPTGQVTHYVHGRWGTEVFGDLYLAPPSILNKAGRIILFSEYPEKQPWLELVPPEKTVRVKTWEEVMEELKNKHKHKAKVAVYPDATIQKPF
ncbi:MAG: lactate racemase domain-containing protein, partial [Candidatus Bathyarchaeota archaeon]|nr:lactate racemase domain-containing protein [Candidatus Bathyarchaeota archaeon]